jgi:transcriptional regulator with XRE-family HTH domain
MLVGERLRELREQKHLSQGDIEERTGLLRCYVSRVENGHTVPAVETLEKFARALEVPLYQLFYDGDKPPEPTAASLRNHADGEHLFGARGKEAIYLHKLRKSLARIQDHDKRLLFTLLQKMAVNRSH